MTDLELAEEMARRLEAIPEDYFWSISLPFEEWQQVIAALRRGHEPTAPEGETLWLIEQTSTVDGKRRFWNGAGYGWDALKAARYPTKEAAEEVARNGFNSEVQTVHGHPEVCEHMFQCGTSSERPPSGEMVMVPKEPTKGIIQAMNETYWKLAERAKLTQGGNVYVDEYATAIYHAMLSAAEASKEAK